MLSDDLPPLGIRPEAEDNVLDAPPNCLCRLAAEYGKARPRLVTRLNSFVDDDLLGPERHAECSESLALGQSPKQAGTRSVGPLDPFGALDCEAVIETKIKGPIQAGSTRCVARVLKLLKEPVTADGVASLLEQRHHNFRRPKGDVRAVASATDCHSELQWAAP
jgi:hypothetical protein